MRLLYARCNINYNSLYITTFNGYIPRNNAKEGLKTKAKPDLVLNAMAIDNPLEYATLYPNNEMQIFIDAEDSLDI